MLYESYFQVENECYFMTHSDLKTSRPTLLFIHGLGDSGINYHSYLNSNLSKHYNMLIPDLLGCGKSSASVDYSFHHQVQGIERHIQYLQKIMNTQFSDFVLVAHSMGGIHATMLCESNLKRQIKAFINVEGSITQFGSFIAESMMNAIKEADFTTWYHDFKQNKIYEKLAQQFILIRPYYASLEFCHPDAFLNNARQMYEMSRELTGKYTHVIGKRYTELTIPRIYCYGDTMCQETIDFLKENNLETQYFPCQNHFLLAECADDFIAFIDEYVKKYI